MIRSFFILAWIALTAAAFGTCVVGCAGGPSRAPAADGSKPAAPPIVAVHLGPLEPLHTPDVRVLAEDPAPARATDERWFLRVASLSAADPAEPNHGVRELLNQLTPTALPQHSPTPSENSSPASSAPSFAHRFPAPVSADAARDHIRSMRELIRAERDGERNEPSAFIIERRTRDPGPESRAGEEKLSRRERVVRAAAALAGPAARPDEKTPGSDWLVLQAEDAADASVTTFEPGLDRIDAFDAHRLASAALTRNVKLIVRDAKTGSIRSRGNGVHNARIAGRQRVETPDGAFECLRVESSLRAGVGPASVRTDTVRWFTETPQTPTNPVQNAESRVGMAWRGGEMVLEVHVERATVLGVTVREIREAWVRAGKNTEKALRETARN